MTQPAHIDNAQLAKDTSFKGSVPNYTGNTLTRIKRLLAKSSVDGVVLVSSSSSSSSSSSGSSSGSSRSNE